MGFEKHRTKELEKALKKYANKCGWDVREELIYIANDLGGAPALKEIDEFVKEKTGVNLHADDFCKLNSKSYNSFFWGDNIRGGLKEVISYLKEKREVFSASALLIENNQGSCIELADKYSRLEVLLDPELWAIDPSPLYELKEKTNGRFQKAIEHAIQQAEELAPHSIEINSSLRAEHLLKGKDGRCTPLISSKAWEQFSQIQTQLGKRGESLGWNDLFNNTLPDGTPLIIRAAEAGQIDAVVANITGAFSGMSARDFNRKGPNGQTTAAVLAEAGQLIPIIHATQMPASEFTKLSATFSEEQRAENAIDDITLRHKIRLLRQKKEKGGWRANLPISLSL